MNMKEVQDCRSVWITFPDTCSHLQDSPYSLIAFVFSVFVVQSVKEFSHGGVVVLRRVDNG